MFGGAFSGKRIALTGHTGFKGAWLGFWLERLGAKVHGHSLPPDEEAQLHRILWRSEQRQVFGDIRDRAALRLWLDSARPDFVFHLAAQSLVRRAFREPLETLETNVIGTANLLSCLEDAASPCVLVVATSDKCYRPSGSTTPHVEDDPLGGEEIYAASKAAAELVVHAWRESRFRARSSPIKVATVRGGNVIGGGDYAPDRIVPDIVRANLAGTPTVLRNPASRRPWQHVFDCIGGYLALAARLETEGAAAAELESGFNIGPAEGESRTVSELAARCAGVWPATIRHADSAAGPIESAELALSSAKAAALLGWRPVWGFDEAVRETMLWYRARHVDRVADLRGFSAGQMDRYTARAADHRLSWAN